MSDGLAFRISDDSGPLLANASLDYVGPLETSPNILADAVAPLTSDLQHSYCEGDPLRAAVTVIQSDASITLAPDDARGARGREHAAFMASGTRRATPHRRRRARAGSPRG